MVVQPCPLRTGAPCSLAENAGHDVREIRAYKLGKRRWSYNQVELVVRQGGGGSSTCRSAVVVQAAASGARFPDAQQGSAVGFLLQLDNGAKVQAHVFLVYDDAQPCTPGCTRAGGGAEGAGQQWQWSLVTREHCCKSCEGPVLRAIQRFGRVGARQARAEAAAEAEGGRGGAAGASLKPKAAKKDPRFMYLSLDEACTHVNATAFRLVAGIYNRQGTCLLGTAVSPPIRVLANNDAPTGAARIPLEATLPAGWEGWAAGAGRRGAAQPARRSHKRPAQDELPFGLGTPSTHDVAQLPGPLVASPALPSLGGAGEQWQLPAGPAGPASPAPRRQRVARQLPCDPEPSPLLSRSCSGSSVFEEPCGGLPAVGAEQLWAALPPAALAAQLAPSLPFYSCSQVAAQNEAERQLSLLQQLKASMTTVSRPSASSCGSMHGPGGCCASLRADMQQSPGRLPATPPGLAMPASGPTRAPSFALHTCDSLATEETTALWSAFPLACPGGGAAGSACLPPPPQLVAGLELGRACSLDGDLELEQLHSLMDEGLGSCGLGLEMDCFFDDLLLASL